MRHAVSLVIALAGLWMILSFDHDPLLLGLGAVSVALSAAIAMRMGFTDREGHPTHLLTHGLAYWPWLLLEIAKSNVAVARVILHPRLPISPQIIKVPTSQRTDLGRVIYANSITLTPGTVSIRVRPDTIIVHALTAEGARSLATGDMDRRISRMEQEG
jgi:multicomponent Na+:H+ antiporter subunit E